MNKQELILITGATGFIGGHLAVELVNSGCRLRLYVRSLERLPSILKENCEIVVGDLVDAEALLRAVEGVSVVFHCAANVSTWDCESNYQSANVVGTERLLSALIKQGSPLARFVHVSTMDVYGFPTHACDENAKLQSCFGYGKSKILGEGIVSAMCAKAKIPYVILRPGNVIGPGSQFIHRIGDALQKGVMVLVDGGKVHAGLLSSANLIEVMCWAASAPEAVNNCFNVRDPEFMDWKTLINQFRAATNRCGPVMSMPYKLAMLSGQLIGSVSSKLIPGREPLWHPLLVNIFGRTCGHDISRLKMVKGSIGAVTLDQALSRSFDWFLLMKDQ